MSAPVIERPRAGTATRTAAPARRSSAPVPAQRPRRTDAQSARKRPSVRTAVRAEATGRASFVLTVMALLGTGLVATLWLSTAAAADSYRLQDARTAARDLSERSEQLHREVAALQSPPALAQRAAGLGMVPAKDPARLVVAPDGGVQVVGEPTPAVVPPPAAVPGGLAGGVAPRARTVTAPQAAPQEVAAAAVAAATPVVEQAVKAAEEADGTGTDGQDADGQDADGRSADGQGVNGRSADGQDADGTTARGRTAAEGAADSDEEQATGTARGARSTDGDTDPDADTGTARGTGRTAGGADDAEDADTTAGTTRTRSGTG